MFKFLQSPFEGDVKSAVEKYTLSAHSAIVWEGAQGTRLITANIARRLERKMEIDRRMQDWFQKLSSGTLQEVKTTLRIIWHENTKKSPQRPFFRADFGRLDFSEPGQGGSGVDGIW